MGSKWDSTLYERKHSFVFQFGADLLEELAPSEGERILDLGCGTGQLSAQIAKSGASVLGIDSSESMVARARENYPPLSFEVMDACTMHFASPFHAVFSNAVLHWVLEPEAAVKSIYLALRSGGRFVAEFGGKGNNASMLRALRSSFRSQGYERNAKINFWYYPSIAEYSILLERHGFYVRKALHFHRETELDGPEGMRNWFRMFGNQFFAGLSDSEMDAVLTDVENQLRPTHFRNGRWYADYKRIRIVATKDDGEFA